MTGEATLGLVGEGLVELALDELGEVDALGFGGDIANVAVMAARLGARPRLLGRVGDDQLGARLVRFWRAAGIDTDWVTTDPTGPTGLYVNEPSIDSGHRFVYHRRGSAGSKLAPQDVTDEFLHGIRMIVVSGITLAISETAAAAAAEAVRRGRARGTRVACVLNHRPALGPDTTAIRDVATDSDILIGSREDALAVFGTPDAASVAAAGRASEVVISDGSRGATLRWESGIVSQLAPTMRSRNAAGAGDALAGAYLAARIERRDPPAALAWAVAAASLSVQATGCARSYPEREEVEALVARMAA
jgi:2-dehydro-3-deoxygluconokinase